MFAMFGSTSSTDHSHSPTPPTPQAAQAPQGSLAAQTMRKNEKRGGRTDLKLGKVLEELAAEGGLERNQLVLLGGRLLLERLPRVGQAVGAVRLLLRVADLVLVERVVGVLDRHDLHLDRRLLLPDKGQHVHHRLRKQKGRCVSV